MEKKFELMLRAQFKITSLKFEDYVKPDNNLNWHKLIDYIVTGKRVNLKLFEKIFEIGLKLSNTAEQKDFYDALNSNKPYDKFQSPPLIYAVRNNNYKLVNFLLNIGTTMSGILGIDVNIVGLDRKNALFIAIEINDVEMVKLLLTASNLWNNYGCSKSYTTPLIKACMNNNIEIVKLLLKNPIVVDINQQDHYLKTALMYACNYNNLEIVKLFLSSPRIDVNRKDLEGNTALIWAMQYRNINIEIIRLLINRFDTDINHMNHNKTNAILLALHQKRKDIFKLLSEHKGVLPGRDRYYYVTNKDGSETIIPVTWENMGKM